MALSIELMEDDLMTEDYTRKRHSVSKLAVHLIFTTKYRRKVLFSIASDFSSANKNFPLLS